MLSQVSSRKCTSQNFPPHAGKSESWMHMVGDRLGNYDVCVASAGTVDGPSVYSGIQFRTSVCNSSHRQTLSVAQTSSPIVESI